MKALPWAIVLLIALPEVSWSATPWECIQRAVARFRGASAAPSIQAAFNASPARETWSRLGFRFEAGPRPGTTLFRSREFAFEIEDSNLAWSTLFRNASGAQVEERLSELRRVESALASQRPLTAKDRTELMDFLWDEIAHHDLGPDPKKTFEILGNAHAFRQGVENTPGLAREEKDALLGLLKSPDQGRLRYWLQNESYWLEMLSKHSNTNWSNYVGSRFAALRISELTRLRLATEVHALIQSQAVRIRKVHVSGEAFHQHYLSGPTDLKAFSLEIPVLEVETVDPERLILSRFFGPDLKSEFGSWFVKPTAPDARPGLNRERFATPESNRHLYRSDFKPSRGDVFALGGIQPLRSYDSSRNIRAGDFDYGFGGVGGGIQFWRMPGQARWTEANLVRRRPTFFASESFERLAEKVFSADARQLEERMRRLLDALEHRWSSTDLDFGVVHFRDLPPSAAKSFVRDLDSIRGVLLSRAQEVGVPDLAAFDARFMRVREEIVVKIMRGSARGGSWLRTPFDPANDSYVPVGYDGLFEFMARYQELEY